MTDRVGQQIGHYRLLRLLGQGAFADVYLGEHQYLERPAAIKVLHVQMDSKTQEQFRREARTIGHLQHPHILQVLDFGIQEQTPYLVMEYAPNGTLRTRHPRETCLPLQQIVSYVKQLAPALDYAHQHHVIHRDIKPENLLLDAQQEVVLSDFGMAVVQQTMESLPTQDPAGTPLYMAPEQIHGKPSAASDQYALAVVVYEWLCGQPPFRGLLFEVYSQHLYQAPPRLRTRLSDLPSAVEEVVLTALAKDPKQRFASVRAFATALQQASQVPLRGSAQQEAGPPVPEQFVPDGQGSPPDEQSMSNYWTRYAEAVEPDFTDHATVRLEEPVDMSQRGLAPERSSPPLRQTQQRPYPNNARLGSAPSSDQLQNIPRLSRGMILFFIALILLVLAGSGGFFYFVRNNPNNPYPPFGTLALDDPLSDNTHGYNWLEGNSYDGTCTFTRGAYHVTDRGPRDAYHICNPIGPNFSNFAYQVQMTIVKGDAAGIIFRLDDNLGDFYVFRVDQNGQYGLFIYKKYFPVSTLRSGSSTAINTGLNKSNLMAVVANGITIDMYVNKQKIDSVSDSSYSQGQIGVFVTYKNGPPEAVFSDAKVWT